MLHSDPDCPQLDNAVNVHSRPRSVYPGDKEWCSVCHGTSASGSAGPSGPWQTLEALDPDDVGGGET